MCLSLTLLFLIVALPHVLAPASAINAGLTSMLGMAQFLAFPALVGGFISLIALVAAALCLRNRSRWGLAASALLTLAGPVMVAASTSVGLPTLAQAQADPTDQIMTVAEWNAAESFEPSAARHLFKDLSADVVVLPEFGDHRASRAGTSRLQEAIESAGLVWADYDVFESPVTGGSIGPVTVIVRKGFARYSTVPVQQTTFGTLRLVSDGAPDIVALHTAPPLPALMGAWSRDLEVIAQLASTTAQEALIVGDFNATLRHGTLATVHSHADALLASSPMSRGTWPTALPEPLRTPIDHILVPTNGWKVVGARTLSLEGSDHVAVVASVKRDASP